MQWLPEQTVAGSQTMSHMPQLLASVDNDTHESLLAQYDVPDVGHTHDPNEQISALEQTWPQLPQFIASLLATQAPPQCSPLAQ